MTDGRAPRLVALVPAFQRADSVGDTVAALLCAGDGGFVLDEVVVIDDGSTDATAGRAAACGARVVRLAENVGKGGAVAAGVEATPQADVYLLVDADLGASAAAATSLLGPVLDGSADMVIGVLPSAGGGGGFGLVRSLAGAGIARATGWEPRAPLSGQRAVRAALLRSLELAPRFGLETALSIDAIRAGGHVVEREVPLRHRQTGRDLAGFVHRARQGCDVARALWPRVSGR